jgi:hypothetical protein
MIKEIELFIICIFPFLMQNNRDIECIALMKSGKAPSGLTLEYMFFNADGQILEKSRKIGLSEDTKLIYLFYRDEKLGANHGE